MLRLVRLRVRAFLNTKWCTRANQRDFGGNVVAVVILLRVVARMSWWRKQEIKHFIILRSEGGVTFFTKDNSANFSSEKWQNKAFRGVYILRIREKNFKSKLILVVVLVLESKGL